MKKLKWTTFEKSLLTANIIISVILFFITKDYSWQAFVGLVASVTSTFSIIYAVKRSILNFVWGFIGSLTYGIIAFTFGNTGEWMLNIIYFLPANTIGFLSWKKRQAENAQVDARKLSKHQASILYPCSIIIVLFYAYIISLEPVQIFLYGLAYEHGFGKYIVDSLSTVLNIIGMILLVKRYAEQWICFILVNISNIILWVITFDPMMLVLWITLLINSIYGFICWRKALNQNLIK